MQRDAAGMRTAVVNTSGNIETQGGSLNIKTINLRNEREGLKASTQSQVQPVDDWMTGESTIDVPVTALPDGSYGFIREKSLLVRVLVTVELIVHVISIAPHTIIWLLLKIQSGSVFPEDTAQLLSQGRFSIRAYFFR